MRKIKITYPAHGRDITLLEYQRFMADFKKIEDNPEKLDRLII